MALLQAPWARIREGQRQEDCVFESNDSLWPNRNAADLAGHLAG